MNINEANNELKSFGLVLVKTTGCPKHTAEISIQQLPIKDWIFIGDIKVNTTYTKNPVFFKIDKILPDKALQIINDYCRSFTHSIKNQKRNLKRLKKNLNA